MSAAPFSIQKNRRRLAGQEYVDQSYANLDLRNAQAYQSRWVRCTFTNCKLDQAYFADATFVGCVFTDCSLTQATLVTRIYSTTFENCNLDQVLLKGADIQDSRFTGRAQYSDWQNATILRTEVSIDLHGARMDITASTGVDWSGSNLWGAVVPLGCAFFAGNIFDKRSLHVFLALVTKTRGNDNDRSDIGRLVDARYKRIVDRLVLEDDSTIDGDSSATRNDEGGAVRGSVSTEEAEVRIGSDHFRIVAG